MAFPWGPVIGAAGGIIGGLIGRSGQKAANEANLKIARDQMSFQERMSNTAYSRSAVDLENAGLNRILALGRPASTPAGALATMQNIEGPMQEGISRGAGTAIAVRRQNQELKNMKAQAELIHHQKHLTAQQLRKTHMEGSKEFHKIDTARAEASRAKLEAELYQKVYGGWGGQTLYMMNQGGTAVSTAKGIRDVGRQGWGTAKRTGRAAKGAWGKLMKKLMRIGK